MKFLTLIETANALNVSVADIRKNTKDTEISPYRLTMLAARLNPNAHQFIMSLGVAKFIEIKVN